MLKNFLKFLNLLLLIYNYVYLFKYYIITNKINIKILNL